MRRTLLLLGRTPLIRRIVAALLLIGSAVAVAVLRSEGAASWVELAAHLGAALLAFIFLHYRWRARERRSLTPRKIRDTFS